MSTSIKNVNLNSVKKYIRVNDIFFLFILWTLTSFTNLLASEIDNNISAHKRATQPSPLEFQLTLNDDFNEGAVFFNCYNATYKEQYDATYCINPKNNSTCSITIEEVDNESSYLCESGSWYSACISCPECSVTLGSDYVDWETIANQTCFPYYVDKLCPVSIDYVRYSNLKWSACHEGTALGFLTNPKFNENCFVKVDFNNKSGTVEGRINCLKGIADWEVDPTKFISSEESNMLAVNDGSCSIPHFKCEELVWSWCLKGNGEGTCTDNFSGTPLVCSIQISSHSSLPCEIGANGCGTIDCARATGLETLCYASWNMPDELKFYDSPHGCMSTSNPSANTNENNLILPLSIAGGGVFIGIVSIAATAAICLCYSKHRRRDYQSVE